jgi:Abortive infection alpha
MIFRKQRAAVRNATRVIRDLVVRPGRELAAGGGLSGGLGALSLLAAGPLRQVPEMAARLPGALRDLGDRVTAIPGARRRPPALAFAAQALAGSVRHGATLRERYLNLLAAAMDDETSARVHPAFLNVLRQLTADEVRLISLFQHDGPYPLLTVVARYRFGGAIATELRNFSLLGREAGCEHPDRVPLYIDNLCRLGLTEIRAVRVTDDTRGFKALEQAAEVKSAIARIEANPPAPLKEAAKDDDDRVVPDVQRKALYVTDFGRRFYEACEYRPDSAAH